MLAKNLSTPRASRMHALALTIFASTLAPTKGLCYCSSRFFSARVFNVQRIRLQTPGLPATGRHRRACAGRLVPG
ncbi:hypothetical protein FJD34_13150 [Pseudomonas brenneri]|uniref:Uncharacterized protein n=1 Tax=Pseudomonas brenneri TaxID=129817 RepID=A0A5B2UNK3_9PSED|nr:hypothetical protein F1720_20690 [Pseudomonas brenneri]TWR78786.1 hypothetical protein FJD34_13150 [Pseudomonas brenneri]